MSSIDRRFIAERTKIARENPLQYARIVESWLHLGKPRKALKQCLRLTSTRPDYLPGQWLLATCFLQMGKHLDARRVVTTTLEKFGSTPRGLHLLADIFEQEGDVKAAQRIWIELYRSDPFDMTIERKLDRAVTKQIETNHKEFLSQAPYHLSNGYALCSAAEAMLAEQNIADAAANAMQQWDAASSGSLLTTAESVELEDEIEVVPLIETPVESPLEQLSADVIVLDSPVEQLIEIESTTAFQPLEVSSIIPPDPIVEPALEVVETVPEVQSAPTPIKEDNFERPETISVEEALLELPAVKTELELDSPKPRRKRRPLITKTIAELYAQQAEYKQAAEIYQELIAMRPAEIELRKRWEELCKLAETSSDRRTNEEPD